MKVKCLEQMVCLKELELEREREKVNALRWELMMDHGIGQATQAQIVEKVSATVSEKLGAGLVADPAGNDWGDSEQRGTTLAPVLVQNFADSTQFSEECKTRAGDECTCACVCMLSRACVSA